MNSVPTMDNNAFKQLSLGAQCLWFHLGVRAQADGDRWSVPEPEAATLRRELGIDDEAVRALLRNGFISAENGRVYISEEGVWMPGPVVEQNGEPVVLFIYPGSRMVIWRESLATFRKKQIVEERKRAERHNAAAYFE